MKDKETIIAATLIVVAAIDMRIIKEENAFFFAEIRRLVIMRDKFKEKCLSSKNTTH